MSDKGRLVARRYRLTERIGSGGMGTVWRAEDDVLGRQVALKRIHAPRHLSDDELATLYERTRREARSAARITHPNVVVVHDVVDDDEGLPCIVMEYVPSTTLGALLKERGTVPPQEAARIGRGMVAALRAAHAAGVLHRDVKPGNVLLSDADDRIVLTDFGIAVTSGTSTLTRTGEMIGSIEYMAPERVRGRKPGPFSDLWALGATLYQAVEGQPPFRRDTAIETAYANAVDPLPPMRHAGPLAPLIEALLAKEPDERPSAEETERELRAVAAEAPTRARAPRQEAPDTPAAPPPAGAVATPGRTGGSRRQRHRVMWSAVAVALTTVAAAGAFSLWPDDGGQRDGDKAKAPATAPPPVPRGYHLVEEKKLGVSFPVPNRWKLSGRTNDGVKYIDPSGLVEITIGMVDPAGPTPVAHFRDIEANTKKNYDVVRRLRLDRTTFRGQPAAIWECTFVGRVRTFRAIDLGFGREGGKEYDVYLSAPDEQWGTYRPIFDKVKQGLRTH
ncbi:serine/threonine-protein kinase [Streptomyces sp. NPDC021212]|uniref:serine/threonine-protein kinase n=1 Tax=Streptomyces sp. NPDC021212 TaxID=3365118 RepID=UPI0037BD8753